MTKRDQIKILNDKLKANNAQYKIDRLNAEISAFSEGNLDKYEFLTRKDLKYKPNALDKAKFEFSPLGKAFNQGLDKQAIDFKDEGVIKILKDIRDRMVRPIGVNNGENNGGNDNGNNGGNNGLNNDDDDNRNDNENNDDNGNDYDDYGDEYLLKLDRLLKNLKDDKFFLKTFSENIDDKSKEELEAEKLERKFEILKNRKLVKERIDALRK